MTTNSISERKGVISLYLTTAVMLMGLDLDDIELIGMIRPFSSLHSFVQASGRAGRSKNEKRKVAFFLLFNKYGFQILQF